MKEYLINVTPLETRIALIEDGRLAELNVERKEERSLVGNIYKGRVDAIVPGIQAAFIDIGLGKNGFLYVADIAAAEGTGDFDPEDDDGRRSKSRKARRPSIENMLKKNQSIMVQVSKDTLGTKGARLTNYVTLPGRYVVLMPTVRQLGVSRKINDLKERDRLKKIIRGFRRSGNYGLILRTAGEGKPKQEIEADLQYLNRAWERIGQRMESPDDHVLLYEDLNPILRTVRDSFTEDVARLTIDDKGEYDKILHFLDNFAPQLKKNCKLYESKRPLFDKYGMESEIEKALRRRVYLKSGGHIVIDQTEALIAIDVNTGKFTGRTHLEETVLKTNLEAADEIARQVRLRDMGGIIVLDFIDMEKAENRKKLLRQLHQAVKPDRARTTISEITELGMIEMTRKRVRHNLIKALSQTCPYCEGTGMVRSVTTMTSDTLRRLRTLFCKSKEKNIILQVHPDVARRLRTENKDLLDEIAKEFDREIQVESVSDFHVHDTVVLSARTRKEVAHYDAYSQIA